jgi:DNA primase
VEAARVSIFDGLRERISVDRILETDSGGKTRCVNPDHQDANPSMQIYDDHAHCYSCSFHGDVTDVWMVMHGFASPFEAALDLAREFNIPLPEMSPEARRKAEERREKQAHDKDLAQACHNALGEHPHVREWWEKRGFGAELQSRFLLGANKDGTEAVIPFWHKGEIRGLIRRKLEGEPKYRYPSAEEFIGGYRPLFIPKSLGSDVFLVEGIIDALALAAAGRSAIAVGGTNISNAQMADLGRLLAGDARVYILPDGDEPGMEAARTWARHLYPRALVCKADYGAEDREDAADLFAETGATRTAEHLDRLAATSEDLMDIEAQAAAVLGSPKSRFDYAVEKIIPLAARLPFDSSREAALGIVAGQLDGVNAAWLKKALAEELGRRESEVLERLVAEQAREQERQSEEYRKSVEEAQGDIDDLFGPGVLGRLRSDAAEIHNVRRDEKALELSLLVALGAQLVPLPNGRPLGPSMLLTADAGRGKNHILDAAVTLLPEEFYLSFEIASGQSFYYAAAEDPAFLKHRFAYPNEIEGVEALVEFLRPMLSKGWARKFVTNKDSDGRYVIQEIIVEGPVTAAIPTVRNTTDKQLQTRLLVAELPDYVGRVKEHSKAVSELLHPNYRTADYSYRLFLWHEGFRQLTGVRRVVFGLDHPDFALDDDKISHGARLWANVLGLMVTNAWLEQKSRKVVELPGGELTIEATPVDYEVAYNIFTAVCQRTVVNLSETHRRILDSLYDLHTEFPNREGFSLREIASGAGVSPQTVSNHKTFLTTSAKLIIETDYGLALPEEADPSWWSTDELSAGLPTPEKVKSWWEDVPPDPPSGRAGHAGRATETGQKRHTYAENSVQEGAGQALDTSNFPEGNTTADPMEPNGRVQSPSSEGVDSENGLGKRSTGAEGEVSSVSSASTKETATYVRASNNPALMADDDDGVNV